MKKYVQKNDWEATGDVFVQYHTMSEITPDSEMVWDVGVPVRWADKVNDPFLLQHPPYRLMACATWIGDPQNIPESVWYGFALNFTMNGYLAAGYPREVYKDAAGHGPVPPRGTRSGWGGTVRR